MDAVRRITHPTNRTKRGVIRMEFIYRAYCDKCGHTVEQRDDDRFMSQFFLGSHCMKCGDFKPDKIFDNGWNVEFGYWRWVRNGKFNILKPKTWFHKREWVEHRQQQEED